MFSFRFGKNLNFGLKRVEFPTVFSVAEAEPWKGNGPLHVVVALLQ
jgi:hypothetical protein